LKSPAGQRATEGVTGLDVIRNAGSALGEEAVAEGVDPELEPMWICTAPASFSPGGPRRDADREIVEAVAVEVAAARTLP